GFVPEEATRHEVVREVTAWAHGLARGGQIADHAFVSYQREVERYGGPGLIADAEDLFRRDSVAVIQLLRYLRAGGLGLLGPGSDSDSERAALVALTLDRLCACLVPDDEARHALARFAAGPIAGGSLYRTAGRHLWSALTDDGPVRRLVDNAADSWRPAAERLMRRSAELKRSGGLS